MSQQPPLTIQKNVPICVSNQTIMQVQEYVLSHMHQFGTVEYIYVLTKNNTLKGILSLHELFTSPPQSLIKERVIVKPISAHIDTDPEKIVHLALKHNIPSVPITDKKHVFLGIIEANTMLHMFNTETHEDLMHLEGIVPIEPYKHEQSSIFTHFILRIPWIIVGLVGGLFAAKIISTFEVILEKELILAAFIPLVAYVANAVGSQTQTLYIRALAVQHSVPILRYSLTQLLISTLIGITCWIIIWIISLLIWGSQLLGIIVGLAIFCSILIATVFALLIPFLLTLFKKDPAIGSGPFTTIIQDLLSVLIYFYIATIFIS
jgi:magnesium transporter